MEENITNDRKYFNISRVFKLLWNKKYIFCIVWLVTIGLSCLWIMPQPKYYTCEVKLAPEGGGEEYGGLSAVASSFGINMGKGTTSDAIYPSLYPELFESPEFIVSLLNINVSTNDNTFTGSYYDYLTKHQKPGTLAVWKKKILGSKKNSEIKYTPLDQLNFFSLSKNDYDLFEKVKESIQCSIDKKNDVITISVQAQDNKVCALMADSIRERLQDFIIDYRTKKIKQDVAYFQHITDSARIEYENAIQRSTSFEDAHRLVVSQSVIGQGDKLKNDLSIKQTTYNTFKAQLDAAKAKVQERTPSFTTLKSAYIPVKPTGPKRLRFILGMFLLVTFVFSCIFSGSELKKLFR